MQLFDSLWIEGYKKRLLSGNKAKIYSMWKFRTKRKLPHPLFAGSEPRQEATQRLNITKEKLSTIRVLSREVQKSLNLVRAVDIQADNACHDLLIVDLLRELDKRDAQSAGWHRLHVRNLASKNGHNYFRVTIQACNQACDEFFPQHRQLIIELLYVTMEKISNDWFQKVAEKYLCEQLGAPLPPRSSAVAPKVTEAELHKIA